MKGLIAISRENLDSLVLKLKLLKCSICRNTEKSHKGLEIPELQESFINWNRTLFNVLLNNSHKTLNFR